MFAVQTKSRRFGRLTDAPYQKPPIEEHVALLRTAPGFRRAGREFAANPAPLLG